MTAIPALLLLLSVPIEGTWMGTLDFSGTTLRIVLELKQDAEGKLTGVARSPDQGPGSVPLTASVEGQTFRFQVSSANASFEGKLTGDIIEGTFRQRNTTIALTLKRDPAPNRPQIPKPPYPYSISEGRLSTGNGATVTVPPGDGPFAAVVLIAGSGRQTRDQVVEGHPVFHVLADDLTRKGIAVLRYDKRTTGQPTVKEYALDAAAALDYLRKQPRIDLTRTGLLGHSEGGTVAPLVSSEGVHFQVLLAPPAVPGHELILMQKQAILFASGDLVGDVSADKALYDGMIAGKPDGELRDLALKFMSESMVPTVLSPSFRSAILYDPAPALAAVKVPTLVLFLGKDLQVLPRQNEPVARKIARSNRNIVVEVVPGLNHIGQTARTGLPAEYGEIEETMAPALMERIAAFIKASPRSRPSDPAGR